MQNQVLFLLSLPLVFACGSVEEENIGHREAWTAPNIIYIMLDEWGYFESSLMGHPILETPNIDRWLLKE